MRSIEILRSNFFSLLLLCGFVFPLSHVAAQDSSPTRQQAEKEFQELIELSLKNELDAITTRTDQAHGNTWQGFSQQLHLRGRAGHPDHIRKIADSILAKHEERNRDRTATRLEAIFQEYNSPESNTNGLTRLIQQGELDRVYRVLSTQAKIEPEVDFLHGVKRMDVERDAVLSDPFWLSCSLAVAYHHQKKHEATRLALNLARKILEGDKYSNVDFDKDNDWLPAPAPNSGMTFGSFQQYRATFYWTLVHVGHAELAIQWFEEDVANRKPPETVNTWNFFNQASDVKFLGLVARKHSPDRARELAKSVLGESLSAEAFENLISSSLAFGDIQVATSLLQDAMAELGNEGCVDYHHALILENLIDQEQIELANLLAKRLVKRIEQYESEAKTGKTPTVSSGYWNHSTYAHLANQVVKLDHDLALRLVELHQHNDQREEFDDWVLIEAVKAQCQTITALKHHELTTCCFADDLIEAYIESGQLERARKTIHDASVVVRRSTYSGNSIGGGKKGLTVLDYNSYERIVLAMRAARFEDFELVRNLLDEMTSNYNRREGYRAVTKRIAELHGQKRAQAWIDATSHPISKSGAILGLGEVLFPTPQKTDSIPMPFVRGGC